VTNPSATTFEIWCAQPCHPYPLVDVFETCCFEKDTNVLNRHITMTRKEKEEKQKEQEEPVWTICHQEITV
jgi:hypothetical protein